MADFVVVTAAGLVVVAGLVVLAVLGFTTGDHSGAALARSLRRDLEAAAEAESGKDSDGDRAR